MRAPDVVSPIRSKNGCAVGDLATYRLVNGASIGLLILSVVRDGDAKTIRAKVTTRSAHGYRRGEIVTLRDSAFITRRPRPGEPPNAVVRAAMGSAGRSFVFFDGYIGAWQTWDRPPANAPFYVIDGRKLRETI